MEEEKKGDEIQDEEQTPEGTPYIECTQCKKECDIQIYGRKCKHCHFFICKECAAKEEAIAQCPRCQRNDPEYIILPDFQKSIIMDIDTVKIDLRDTKIKREELQKKNEVLKKRQKNQEGDLKKKMENLDIGKKELEEKKIISQIEASK